MVEGEQKKKKKIKFLRKTKNKTIVNRKYKDLNAGYKITKDAKKKKKKKNKNTPIKKKGFFGVKKKKKPNKIKKYKQVNFKYFFFIIFF